MSEESNFDLLKPNMKSNVSQSRVDKRIELFKTVYDAVTENGSMDISSLDKEAILKGLISN